MTNKVVTVLCSGMGLGVYIPSLLVCNRLRQQGISTEIFVSESYFLEDKVEKFKENKRAFHKSFRVAVMGHKMAKGDVSSNFNREKIHELLRYWKENSRRDFIIVSGNWTGIIEEYSNIIGQEKLNIDILRMDSGVAPSWKNFKNNAEYFNEVWLFDEIEQDVNYQIYLGDVSPIPYNERENRILIHGGGWGMGTYQTKIPQLYKDGYFLDIAAYETKEAEEQLEGNRYFLMDPNWLPWLKDEDGEFQFPPTYEVDCNGRRELMSYDYHGIYHICRKNKAIISKPGGGTLVDSLAAATPVIFLDPIADHEKSNALLWENLGFGISYDRWLEMGCPESLLEEMHYNLLTKRENVKDYTEDYIKRLKSEFTPM